jgi:hypothetical protein
MRRGHVIQAILGSLWTIAAGAAQPPRILSQGITYRAGFISVFLIGGLIVIGALLFIVSVLTPRAGRSE